MGSWGWAGLGGLINPLLAEKKNNLGGSSSTELPSRRIWGGKQEGKVIPFRNRPNHRSSGRKTGYSDSLWEQTHQQSLEKVLEVTAQGKPALKAAKIFLVQGDSSTSVLCELRERQAGKTKIKKSSFLLFPTTHYSF